MSDPYADEADEQGGDPACWLDRVCAACGRLVESGDSCPACGAQLGQEPTEPTEPT
ncbi:MAG: hypothetical protein ACJ74O_18700 [Frankiaceae bacterium]